MLQWDSEIWGMLRGLYGSAAGAPIILRQLMEEYSQERMDELFYNYLFHQSTIYTASYAAVPYLAQLACTTSDPEARKELYINCGVLEASREEREASPYPASWAELEDTGGSSVCRKLYREYMDALSRLKELTASVFAYTAEHTTDLSETRYLLAADAAYRGETPLANMLMTYITGDEYLPECPNCGEEIIVWPGNDPASGVLVVYESDPVWNRNQEPHPIIPADRLETEELRILDERAKAAGEQTLVRQLPYLAGTTDCLSCGKTIGLWSGLLRPFSP